MENERIRVLVDGYPFLKNGRGGVARYVLETVRALRAAGGASVSLQVPRGAAFPPPIPHVGENGVAAFLARRRADVFHSAWYRVPPRLHGAAFVATVYDWIDAELPLYKPNGGDFAGRQACAVAAAAGLVCISEDVTRRTAARTGFPRERIAVAPPAPAAVFRAEPPAEAERAAFRARTTGGAPYVLHVGSRGLYKNFATVLRGFLAASARTDRHLVLVGGERSLTDDEVFRIARAGCLERVHFLRRVPDGELRLAYAAADAYASASHMEGFGLPVVEAMACGTLPVLSDVPVYREVAGTAARYAPPADVGAWADLFAGPLEPVPGARESALSRYSWEKAAAAHLALYRSLAG